MGPTERFSGRVENYIRYRPRYPQEILDTLRAECGLTPDAAIAGIGSGAGFLAGMFLANGNRVYGVEPNREMREAGERLLRGFTNFTSVDAAAEATALRDASVDFVTAGQSLHWFDLAKARAEFARILKPGGWMLIVRNGRRDGASPFMEAYAGLLLRCGTDYKQVAHRRITAEMLREFYGGDFRTRRLHHEQVFDFEALRGRLLSSYVPIEGRPMVDDLRTIFDAHQTDGRVRFYYEATLYWGRIR